MLLGGFFVIFFWGGGANIDPDVSLACITQTLLQTNNSLLQQDNSHTAENTCEQLYKEPKVMTWAPNSSDPTPLTEGPTQSTEIQSIHWNIRHHRTPKRVLCLYSESITSSLKHALSVKFILESKLKLHEKFLWDQCLRLETQRQDII